MSEYVPTTEQMLTAVARSYSHEQAVAWLAAHDAEVAAKAVSDALESVRAERDAQAERVSMEVLDEYRRIAAWLESQAALRGATGDTMHGLAAEALATLIGHEYSRHTIPLYGMLDVWTALHGTSHPGFDEFYDEHGYAEAWSRLMAEIRSRAAVPDAATAETVAERDAALAAVERVRAVHARKDHFGPIDAGWPPSTYAWHKDGEVCANCRGTWPCRTIQALDVAPEPEEKP